MMFVLARRGIHHVNSVPRLFGIQHLLYDRENSSDVAPGHIIGGVRESDEPAVPVDNIDGAVMFACIAQSGFKLTERNDSSKHPGELPVRRQWNGHYKRRLVVTANAKRLADRIESLKT